MACVAYDIEQAPNKEPTLELHSRAAPRFEAHHPVHGPDTERNSGGRRIKKSYTIVMSQQKNKKRL